MNWFTVVFVVVVVNGLDSVQNKISLAGNHQEIEIIHGADTSLSEVRNQCPDEDTSCSAVADKLVTHSIQREDLKETDIQTICPLSNFSVTPLINDEYIHKFIDLKLSWNKFEKDDRVTIKLFLKQVGTTYKEDCLTETTTTNHSLLNNSIFKPNKVMEYEINPGCTYDIFLYSENQEKYKINCTYSYTVPDCVENKCDCDKFTPRSKILNLEPISGNRFRIKWDPGEITIGGYPYIHKEEQFKYIQSSKELLADIYAEPAESIKIDDEKYTSEIVMKLFEGENYTLIGTFRNNFSCPHDDWYYFTAPTKSNYTVSITMFILVALLVVLIALKYNNFERYKNKVLNFIIPGRRRNQQLQDLVTIQSEQIPMNTNIQYTPAELLEETFDGYEFPRNRIIIKEVIGNGAFGQVYSAKAIGIKGIEGYRMVAVKTLGDSENITKEAATDFVAEIEIFKKIGDHPNIVALLGCCTVDTPYMMIMEFVPCGDLKNYLLELRTQWLKRKNVNMNKDIFFPDSSNGAYIELPSSTTSCSMRSGRLPSTPETVTPNPEDPMTPLFAHYADALDKVLDHRELQNFALQIARGMAHLEKIEVTHRDLAARNILINEYKILKISDFGLSRSGPYINHKTKKLPLRWMAIEAIVEQTYDSKSDVWSFGVVLWEIGTLGAFPYESVPDSFIQQFLQMGRRLERPEICTNELYSLMQQCWTADPNKRPTFWELVDALDVKKRKIYANFNQLNPTYVFPPSDIKHFVESPVQIVDIDSE